MAHPNASIENAAIGASAEAEILADALADGVELKGFDGRANAKGNNLVFIENGNISTLSVTDILRLAALIEMAPVWRGK